MINIKNKNECCGCWACMAICPTCAISMQPDEMGFLYPVVDSVKCIDCGLCNKVCSFNVSYDRTGYYETPLIYGAWHKDADIVNNSQSGGLFYTLAKKIIEEGGVVYGAAFKDVYEVIHKRVTSLENLQLLRGSKYVQSNLDNCLRDVLLDLKQGRKVLFSGTGCQIAGLHSLVKNKHIDDKNLILCDIVCHGIPSPFVWRDHVRYIEKKYRCKVARANTRDKKLFGWHSSYSSFELINGRVVTSNDYNKAFGLCYINRRSCDVCYFSNLKRPGDITLGDFWGLEKIKPDLDKNCNGVSLVLINNDKGRKVFESIKCEVNAFESNVQDCIQPNLETPSIASPVREVFEKTYSTKGYTYAMKKYGELTLKKQIIKCFWGILRLFKKLIVP